MQSSNKYNHKEEFSAEFNVGFSGSGIADDVLLHVLRTVKQKDIKIYY